MQLQDNVTKACQLTLFESGTRRSAAAVVGSGTKLLGGLVDRARSTAGPHRAGRGAGYCDSISTASLRRSRPTSSACSVGNILSTSWAPSSAAAASTAPTSVPMAARRAGAAVARAGAMCAALAVGLRAVAVRPPSVRA